MLDYSLVFDAFVAFLTTHSQYIIYISTFSVLVLGGLGFPIPEEVTLLGSGFLAYEGFSNLIIALPVCYAGVLLGDFILFSLGRRWGDDIIKHRLLVRHITEKRLDRARKFFDGHGLKTVFIARFVSGFRIVAFATAGILKMRVCHFLTINTLAALISVPLFILIGYLFGANINTVIEIFYRTDTLIFVSISVSICLFLTYRFWKKKKK
ncbi:MAG: DedA family protein [Thermodesulfobacteriota bacterium]|nr:DedA family protein [Thermodesulfobacteriota bacterium]